MISKEPKSVTKAEDFKGNLNDFLRWYQVYPELTKRLDALKTPFTQESINEIVLWKVGRYVDMPSDLRAQLDAIRGLTLGDEKKAEGLIRSLLKLEGVQIAMASTFLRFANPDVFQIIDSHVYRAVYGVDMEYAQKRRKDDIALYLDYLGELRRICTVKSIPFIEADRILFEFDKAQNPSLQETKREAKKAWKSST